jgi:hypothetical protein
MRYPQLPDPLDLPPYPEENKRDPFGLNAALLGQAIQHAFEVAIGLARTAHLEGLCMTLPKSAPSVIEPFVRPWRSLVQCQIAERDEPASLLLSDMQFGELNLTPMLELTQRAILCSAALKAAAPEQDHQIGELLESVGYLALSRAHLDRRDKLPDAPGKSIAFFVAVGRLMGNLHGTNTLYGDAHPENFGVDPRTGKALILDAGPGCILTRPLTVRERASDLGLLKLSCSFEEWEAVRYGYYIEDSDPADAVLALL